MTYKKMSLIPTPAGWVYECYYCNETLATTEADTHVCVTDEDEEYIDYYAESSLFGDA